MSKETTTFPESADSEINVNREYKSSVFKAFFSIRENCLALYNAVNFGICFTYPICTKQ